MEGVTRMKKLSKGKQELLDYLGAPYEVKVIDRETCVYLNLGDYDIEISGGSTSRSKFNIYVWQIKGGMRTVEIHIGVKNDLLSIKGLLDDIRRRCPKEDFLKSDMY